jgi:CRP-like cAMP-binding protein
MTERDELVRSLAGLALFADLGDPDLAAIADPELERHFGAGERVLRRGLSGGGFFVILDGDAVVEIAGDDEPRRLRRGDFFGEVSTLLDCKPTADVVAHTELHALEIPGPQLEAFLLQYPHVTYRMLQTVARRLRDVLN